MSSLLERKLQQHSSEYVTDSDLCTLLPGTANARHAQVKRALAKGYLVRVCRGFYFLSGYLQHYQPHPFEIAQRIYGPSYISLESAFSYHNLIPEAVYSTTSVTIKRANQFKPPIGHFIYYHLPIHHFFYAVERISDHKNTFFMATPWKAITDYVYCYKHDWKSIIPLESSLRIEIDELPTPTENELEQLKYGYQSRRINTFIEGIKKDYQL